MGVRSINNTCLRIYVRVIVLLMVMVLPFSCRQQNGQEPEDKTGDGGSQVSEPTHGSSETLVYSGLFPVDTCYVGLAWEMDYRDADVFVCDQVWSGLLVAQVGEYDYLPWRLPSRKEAGKLKELSAFDGSSRFVCVDAESGAYYTFKYGGSVTKAGEKTKYSVRPIRVEYKSDSIIVYL